MYKELIVVQKNKINLLRLHDHTFMELQTLTIRLIRRHIPKRIHLNFFDYVKKYIHTIKKINLPKLLNSIAQNYQKTQK